MRIYFDTSFLFSLFAPDANSEAAADAMAPGVKRLLTAFGELELRNALQLGVFRKELTPAMTRAAYGAFQKSVADGVFEICPLPERWRERSHQIATQHTATLGTRTLDLIHVASALELKADALFTFDKHQRGSARALKLKLN